MPPPAKATTISATEVARSLSDLLNRIQYRGERFLVMRNGAEVAEISPPRRTSGTLADLVDRLEGLPPVDDGFADELAEIRAATIF